MKKIILSLFCVVLLCGCSGYKEVNDGYLVTGIAFERLDGGVKITASIILPQSPEGVILSAVGSDLSTALCELKKSQVNTLYFEHCGAVVLNQNIKSDALKIFELCKTKIKIPISAKAVYCDNAEQLFLADRTGYDIISLLKNNHAKSDNRIFKIEQAADSISLPLISVRDKTMIFEGEIK